MRGVSHLFVQVHKRPQKLDCLHSCFENPEEYDEVYVQETLKIFKGTVQRKLRGVESYISQKDFVSY